MTTSNDRRRSGHFSGSHCYYFNQEGKSFQDLPADFLLGVKPGAKSCVTCSLSKVLYPVKGGPCRWHSTCGLANFFHKGSDCEYFRLCRPHVVSVAYSCLFFFFLNSVQMYKLLLPLGMDARPWPQHKQINYVSFPDTGEVHYP